VLPGQNEFVWMFYHTDPNRVQLPLGCLPPKTDDGLTGLNVYATQYRQ